ncbi:hypothetical protein KJR37_01545 [Streptococcus salivarius]|nr:hypothetical protein [Streptococcus sp. 10.1]MBK5160530.1 hypothetical protein [Streptococcus sp. 9.1]MBT0939831.1 hypothetical protein [Streptococcus salivarius]
MSYYSKLSLINQHSNNRKTAIWIYVMHHDYKDMKSVVDKLYKIMHSCMQHSYQPGIIVFEAKYYLFYENNKDKATELYHTATVLAKAFGDQVFIKNLKMEMKKDLNLE